MMRVGALVLTICAGAAPSGACDLPSGGIPLVSQAETDLRGALYLQEIPVPVSGPFKADVIFCPQAESAPVSGVRIDARMPIHQHGMNYFPVVTQLSENRFNVANLVFHMPGAWEITVSANVGDAVSYFTADVPAQ